MVLNVGDKKSYSVDFHEIISCSSHANEAINKKSKYTKIKHLNNSPSSYNSLNPPIIGNLAS